MSEGMDAFPGPSPAGKDGANVSRNASRSETRRQARRRLRARIRKLNRQLRRRVDELEILFALAPVGLAIARDAECRHIEPNPAFRRMLRLPLDANASRSAPEDERPTNFRVFRDGAEVPADELPMQVVSRTGVPINGSECHVVFDDGSLVDLLGSSAPLFDEQDRPRGCIGAFLDVTDWKRANAELKQARAQAEALSRAKDRFLAVLSHELRGPLSPIATAVAYWRTSAAELPADLREDLGVMDRGVRTLTRLINDLHDTTGIANGKLNVHPRPLDLHHLIAGCVDVHRGLAAEKGLTLTLEAAAPLARVDCDVARMEQVFGNLLRNAIKFTPAGGAVVVRTDNPAPGDADGLGGSTPSVRASVRDTGIGLGDGVSPDALFDPFEQGNADRGSRFGGLGLGLSICRGLVHAHGGRITASSEGRDRGTTVTVVLPLVTAAESN